jgi:cell division protein FtsQ
VGENILSLDLVRLKARLQASPWVAEATVSRALPDTLRVDVRERVPLALAEVERLYLMDADGTLIDLFGPRTAGFDLPVVRGLAEASAEARRVHGQRLAALLTDLAELSAEVSELEVEPAGHIRVVLKGRGEVLRVDAPPYRNALRTFLTLRAQLAERCPDAEYFDLRFRDRIYVKRGPAALPGPAGPAPAAAPVPARPPAGGLAPPGVEARPATLLVQPGAAAVASRR